MQESGWGFDVYRTSFGDDELFQRYIDYVRNAMIRGAEDEEQAPHVASKATLYPKEEQGGQHLENLSLDEVRKLHMEWVAAVQRDVPKGKDDGLGLARSHYFMLVNDEVLERFRLAEEKLAQENLEPEYFHEGVMAIMCVGYEQEEDDDDNDNELKGRMWQYVWADSLSELYDMIEACSTEWWITAFAWPPEVYGSSA
ncbi:hypothetical protein PG984_010036 [Apiospora sp. TS-2023a]